MAVSQGVYTSRQSNLTSTGPKFSTMRDWCAHYPGFVVEAIAPEVHVCMCKHVYMCQSLLFSFRKNLCNAIF